MPVIVAEVDGAYRVEAFTVPTPVDALWDPVDHFFIARLCPQCYRDVGPNDILYEFGPDWCQRCGAALRDEDARLLLMRVVYVGEHTAYVDHVYPPGSLVGGLSRKRRQDGEASDAVLSR